MNQIITFEVNGRVLSLKDKNKTLAVSDNECYKAVFEFSGQEEALMALFARFIDENEHFYDVLLDENFSCAVPSAVLKSVAVEVGLYSDGFATTACKFCVAPSILENSKIEAEPPEVSQTQELISLVNKIVTVKEANVDSNNDLIITLSDGRKINAGYVKGDKGDKGDKGEKGEKFIYEDFTASQLEKLKYVRFDGGYVDEQGFMHLTLDSSEIENYTPFFVGFGGSGGASSKNYKITLRNLLDSRSITVAEGKEVVLSFFYQSVDEDSNDDGAGFCTVYVDGVKAGNETVIQGENSLDVSKYLSQGTHTVKLTVSNSEEASRTLLYNIDVISLKIETTLSEMSTYSGDVTFFYTPTGIGEKTVHFIIDSKEISTQTVSSTARSQSFVIPAQEDGAHIFECYAQTTVNAVSVQSEKIRLGMIWQSGSKIYPSIVSLFNTESLTQGQTVEIKYLAVNPLEETTSVKLEVIKDSQIYFSKTISVGAYVQSWTVSDYPSGEVTFKISSGNEKFEKTVFVEENEISFNYTTDSLVLDFDPTGRSNSETDSKTWSNGKENAQFSDIGFFEKDGWLNDENGCDVFRILPGGQMTIPFEMKTAKYIPLEAAVILTKLFLKQFCMLTAIRLRRILTKVHGFVSASAFKTNFTKKRHTFFGVPFAYI